MKGRVDKSMGMVTHIAEDLATESYRVFKIYQT
jgi:hypothetical protein